MALGDAAVAVTAVSESLAAGELEEAEALARRIGIRHRVIRTEEFADPNYLRNQHRPLLFLQERAVRPALRLAGELGVDVIASGREPRRRGRPPPRHAGRGRERRAASPAGVRAGQGRRPRPGQGLGPAHLGQARDPLPLQPDRLRRGRDSRARPDDRPGRAVAPPDLGPAACSASAITRATWPASRSPSTTCPGSSTRTSGADLLGRSAN